MFSSYASRRQPGSSRIRTHTSEYVRIRQHTCSLRLTEGLEALLLDVFKALHIGKESIATRLSAVYSRALQIREHTQVCRYISSVLHRGGALAYADVC